MTLTRSTKFRAIALTSLFLMLSGCASPRVVTETRTVEVPVEVPVQIDERLTRDIPPPDLVPETWRDLAVLVIHYRKRYEAYRERMSAIREGRDE